MPFVMPRSRKIQKQDPFEKCFIFLGYQTNQIQNDFNDPIKH